MIPEHGQRVFVIPRQGLSVQRAAYMYGQFLSAQGQEVIWDSFLDARRNEGAFAEIREIKDPAIPDLSAPPVEPKPAPPPVPEPQPAPSEVA